MEKQKPTKKFKVGSVEASIWENVRVLNGKETVVPSIRIERVYKDGEQLKRTSAFGPWDLPRVRLVAEKAYEFLVLQERGATENVAS